MEDNSVKFPLEWKEERCIRCGLCVGVCPFDALTLKNNIIWIDEEKCTLCGLCVKGCPTFALVMDEKLAEIRRKRGVKG